jgi:hypothetical protein
MKLFISENIDKGLQGYITIPIINGEVDLAKIPNNSATSIIAIDAIDSISYDKIFEFLNLLITKMRLNCNLYLGGVDIYAISRELISGSKTIEDYNKEVCNKGGVYSSKLILNILEANNIKVNSVVYKGNKYEISATRPEHKN